MEQRTAGAPPAGADDTAETVIDLTAAGASTDRGAVATAPEDLVVRGRLLEAVGAGVEGPLTLVCAPAGSGKTALLDSWSAHERSGRPVVRVVLEAGDERPAVLWPRLLDAVRDRGLDVAPARRADPVSRLAAAVQSAGTPVVLVLDGTDRMLATGAGEELVELSSGCGGDLRLVLLCRADPPLPLHLYRLAGTLTEIRADDLAFTVEEAAELFRRSGDRLTASQVAAVHGRCRGWAAGLRFAAVMLQRGEAVDPVVGIRGDSGDVSRYLQAQVLDTQPPPVRDALLRSSVADELEPELLARLVGPPHAEQLLDVLSAGNVLLERLPAGRGHRYHPLLAELLQARLRAEQPDAVADLHLVVADWAAQHGSLLPAARHHAAAGAWSEAAGHLVDDLAVGLLLTGPDGPCDLEPLRAVPADAPGAAAAVVRAALALADGDLVACRSQLDAAAAAVPDEPEPRGRGVELAVAVLEALLAEAHGHVAAATASAAEAASRLAAAPRSVVFAHPELGSLVHACLGRLALHRGELLVARQELALAATLAEQAGSDTLQVEALGFGALAEAVNGRLRRSLGLAQRARSRSSAVGLDRGAGAAAAATALAWVRMEQYDVAAVAPLLEEARGLLARSDAPLVGAALALVEARHERACGDLDTARAELHGLGQQPDPAPWLVEQAAAAEADVLTAMGLGGPRQARSPVGSGATADGAGTTPLGQRVDDLLARAEAARHAQRPSRASLALARALRLAAPEHMRRPFLEVGPGLRGLLVPGSELAGRHPWLAGGRSSAAAVPRQATGPGSVADRTAAPPTACADGTVVVEPLTAKEREVLGHLAMLLTTEEIAEAMFVSVNTVRTHVRNVLRKLSATRRNEAVRRAWELQLLPRRADVAPRTRSEPA